MEKWVAAVFAVAAVLVAAAAVYTVDRTGGGESGGHGLLVVATMPGLSDDVAQLLCSDDRVETLVRPGADPHTYQLRPSDVELVKKADLIVSLGHAGFEVKLREIVDPSKIVEIPRLEGVRLLRNPVTGQPVYHMPIYDPGNYRVFMEALEARLEKLRPSCAAMYRERLGAVLQRLGDITSSAPRLNRTAVASTPVVLYAVEWMGLRVEHLLLPEHGAQVTQDAIDEARRMLEDGAVAVIMVRADGSPATKADEKLAELAGEAGAPLLRVKAPFLPGSTLDKLGYIVEQARRLQG